MLTNTYQNLCTLVSEPPSSSWVKNKSQQFEGEGSTLYGLCDVCSSNHAYTLPFFNRDPATSLWIAATRYCSYNQEASVSGVKVVTRADSFSSQ
ncbi:hypothetical protein BaRGS_00020625, partial [Batillaria attramentaria]